MCALDIRRYKTQLREQCKALRAKMDEKERLRCDTAIKNRVKSLYQYRHASQLITYVSTAIEVDTRQLIREALKAGKRVAVPYCIPGTRQMEFYYLRSFDEDLESGAFGVLEPKIGRCEKMTDFSNSICIVPGLAFDNEGYRLGYGKGYYDRFLCNYPGVKIGICYASCVKRELPHGFYDVPVGILVTDRYLHRVKLQNSRFRRR